MNLSRRAFLSRSSLGVALAAAAAVVPALSTVLKLPAPLRRLMSDQHVLPHRARLTETTTRGGYR